MFRQNTPDSGSYYSFILGVRNLGFNFNALGWSHFIRKDLDFSNINDVLAVIDYSKTRLTRPCLTRQSVQVATEAKVPICCNVISFKFALLSHPFILAKVTNSPQKSRSQPMQINSFSIV